MSTNKPKLGEGATPGPWTLCPRDKDQLQLRIVASKYDELRSVPLLAGPLGVYLRHGEDGTPEAANARLIAKAPLLIEARDVLENIETYLDNRADVDDGIPNSAMKLYQEVRALLAKLDAE